MLNNAIVNTLQKLGNGVSYGDLSKLDGFSGEWQHGSAEYNQFFWFECSAQAIEALKFLINEEIITLRPINPTESLLLSMADGKKPNFPIATKQKKYKEPHWVPVVFDKGPKLDRFNPTK